MKMPKSKISIIKACRDLIVHMTPDQASMANQLISPVVIIPPILTKRQSLSEITKYLESLNNTVDPVWIQTLRIALLEIGKCLTCQGIGEYQINNKPEDNYKVKVGKNGSNEYWISCDDCTGTGKQLDVKCKSCGINASIMPDQRHFSYCPGCEIRLTKSGFLK